MAIICKTKGFSYGNIEDKDNGEGYKYIYTDINNNGICIIK